MRRFLREQSLSLVFLGLFLAALAGQAYAGWQDYNNSETWHAQMAHEAPQTLSFARFLTTSDFAQAVTENWQSEYLQFTLFILLTVWFVQKGSPESKQPGEEGGESDEEQSVREHAHPRSPAWARAGGWRLALYSNSLVLVMGLIWVWCWFAQSVAGWSAYNAELLEHEQPALSLGRLPRLGRLLADDAAELAVGVPRRRLDGRALDLPAPARLAGVKAGRLPPRHDRGRRLTQRPGGGFEAAVDPGSPISWRKITGPASRTTSSTKACARRA